MTEEKPGLDRLAPALDAIAIGLVAILPTLAWQREGVTPAEGKPSWVFDSDQYLYGPDAAAWAQNALALHQGRLADLDPHRLPTWTILTAGAMRWLDLDVAMAGHLVNRAEFVLLGPVVYLLGRALGLRAFALLAAALVAMQPMLLASACRFSVDPTVTFLVPLTLLTAWCAGRWWWTAAFGGMIAGLTMVCHLTTIAYPATGLLFCLAAGRGWWRVASLVLYAAGAYLVFRYVFSIFPILPDEFFRDALAEGITPTGGDLTSAGREAAREHALETLRVNAPVALDTAVRLILSTFRPVLVPWAVLLPVAWLGCLGPDAVRRPAEAVTGSAAWATARRVGGSLAGGFALATASAPLVAFAAAKSPERYSWNLLAAGAVLFARGAATLVAGLVHLPLPGPGRAALRGRLELGLAVACTAAWAWGEWEEPHQRAPITAPMEERRALSIGQALSEHFPPGIGAASCLREALPYAGLTYCPHTVCPFDDNEVGYRRCVAILREECTGEGDIPLVVTGGLTLEQRGEKRAHFETWIGTRLKPVANAGGADIYAIPRTGDL